MSANQNQEVFRRVIEEGFNRGNYDALDPLFSPDYVEHQFGLKTNLEGFKKDIQSLRSGFSDFRLTIEEMVSEGNKVWVRMTARGTHDGPFFGPPTGKPMTITVFDICRFENGRIVEHWGVPDRFAMLAQLGLLPRPEPQH
jgi:predicted ester cyclase